VQDIRSTIGRDSPEHLCPSSAVCRVSSDNVDPRVGDVTVEDLSSAVGRVSAENLEPGVSDIPALNVCATICRDPFENLGPSFGVVTVSNVGEAHEVLGQKRARIDLRLGRDAARLVGQAVGEAHALHAPAREHGRSEGRQEGAGTGP